LLTWSGGMSSNNQVCHGGRWCWGRGLKKYLTVLTVVPTWGPADPTIKALCNVSPLLLCRAFYVPTVRALRGLKTYCPHPSTLVPLHIWSPSTNSVLSHNYARGRAAGSSAKGEEERRKQKTAFQPASDFPRWKQGERAKAGCRRKSGFPRPWVLGYEC
jgi:hypothetical protein